METGKVKFYLPAKEYGFITSDADGRDYFFGHSDMVDDVHRGDEVFFELVETKKGFKAKTVVKK
jgi:cold shock CspA family protein